MESIFKKLKQFAAKSKRVWLVLKKPSKQEFSTIAKISAIGIVVLGALGFMISIIIESFI